MQQQTQPQPPPGSVAGYNATTNPQTVNANALPQGQTQVQGSPSASTVGVMGKPGRVDHFSSYVKSNPGKSIAIAGGLGLVAEACGVNVLSDAVAGSRVYANIQNAKQRKKPQSTIPNSHNTLSQLPYKTGMLQAHTRRCSRWFTRNIKG